MGSRLRPDDPGVTAVAASLTAGVFFGGVAGGVAFPTLPSLGPVLGIAPFLVGVILSANRATRLLLNAPVGGLIDRLGVRRPMLAGFALMGLSPFGYVLGLDPPVGTPAVVFLAARVLWGVGTAFVFVGAFSTITHVTTAADRGRWTGYMRGGQTLGFPAGLVIGGVVTDAYGYATAFAVAGVAGLVATAVAWAVLPDVHADVDRETGLRAIPGLVRDDPRVGAVGLVNFCTRFLFAGVLLSTVVLYAADAGIAIPGFSAIGASGLIMAASVVVSAITTVIAGRLSDALSDRALVTIGPLCSLAAGFALLAAVPTLPGVVAAVAMIGLGVGGTNPPLLAYLGDVSPAEDVGKLGGVYNLFGDVGSTLGPLVALPAVGTIGFEPTYWACGGLALLALGLVSSALVGAGSQPARDADPAGEPDRPADADR